MKARCTIRWRHVKAQTLRVARWVAGLSRKTVMHRNLFILNKFSAAQPQYDIVLM